MLSSTDRTVIALSLLSLAALAFILGLTSCDKNRLVRDPSSGRSDEKAQRRPQCSLKVRGQPGMYSKLLVGHLQERSEELLSCANQYLPSRSPANLTVLRFSTRRCDGVIQDDGTELRASRKLQQFVDCSLAALREGFPNAEFVNGRPCIEEPTLEDLMKPDLTIRTSPPGAYEIVIPSASCHFETIEVDPSFTEEELQQMVERAEASVSGNRPRPEFSIERPFLNGSCDRAGVEQAVRSKRSHLKSCYENAMKHSRDGYLMATFAVDDDGQVSRVKLVSAPENSEVEECVTPVVRGLRFATQQGGCHVKLPLSFVAEP